MNAHPFWKKHEMRAPAQTVKCGLVGALYVCRKKKFRFCKVGKKMPDKVMILQVSFLEITAIMAVKTAR